jgi:small subunit ribosomal protein S20
MPAVHKSTIKQRNRARLSLVKGAVKKVLAAIEEKNQDTAAASLREATAALHKAVTKGVLKPNTASRRISRLTARVNALATAKS